MAVLSNKPQEATRRMVAALCDRWPFVAVEGFRDEEHRKPDPRVATEIVAKMRAAPREVWMLGDSQTDIATARAAGLVAVAATWGFRDRDVLAALSPDYLIDHPTDLLGLL
jgi:phosphoglycolate phosphatase